MFEGLNWRNAFKRAAIFTAIWMGLVYVMHTINPKFFQLGDSKALLSLALNSVVFFFIYALFFAFIERRKARTQADAKGTKSKPDKTTKTTENGEELQNGALKGQYNPNSSRKKSRRRR